MEDAKDEKDLFAKNQNSREYLANERTFLAWMRTCIAIMAFGFVVVKFSLFIRQISVLLDKNASFPQNHYSSYIGSILVAVGVITLVFSYIRFRKTQKQISSNSYYSSSRFVQFFTLIILILSVCLILYLIGNINRL